MTVSRCHQLMSTINEHDSLHELIDVACEVPALLEQSKKLIASSNIIPEQCKADFFKPSFAMLEKLHDHHEKYRAENARPLYWAMPSGADNPADGPYKGKLFPFALHFQSLKIASEVVLWWTIVLQVLCSIMDLYQHIFGSSILSSAFDQFESEDLAGQESLLNPRFPTISSVKEEADKLARYLCQSIEYFHKIENGISGPQMTCYAQWVLKSYFQQFHQERELDWCLNIKKMRGPGFRNGIELMGFHN